MFILCSKLSLGTVSVTLLSQELPSLGTMEVAVTMGVHESPVPTTAGKGFQKNSGSYITMNLPFRRKMFGS